MTPLPADRQALVLEHLPLAFYVARRINEHLPPFMAQDLGDRCQDACMGLIAAAAKFEPALAIPFSGYAGFRIRKMVLEGLRRMDYLTRAHRKHLKAADEDVVLLSIEDREGRGVLNDMHDDAPDPETLAALSEASRHLWKSIRLLKPRTQHVLWMYWWESRTEKEIADRLKIGESRVSQILTDARRRLKTSLETAAAIHIDRHAKKADDWRTTGVGVGPDGQLLELGYSPSKCPVAKTRRGGKT